jgi:hypothetical protein
MLLEAEPLPHLICSRPIFFGGVAGVAVKLRCLREFECDPDVTPGAELAQCIATIEREIAARAGRF